MSKAPRPGHDRPFTLLIAALGGEGGGLLTDWIVDACTQAGILVQSTSIPGVAQRTGATTYYIEIMSPGGDGTGEPLFALYPAPGFVDMAVASELVEAGRLIENGYVTPDRTILIASRHRVYAMSERTAMGDGGFHAPRITDAAMTFAHQAVLRNFEAAARGSNSAINALLLGAMAAADNFPLSEEQLKTAIRTRGVAVDANIAGFDAGRDLALSGEPEPGTATEEIHPPSRQVTLVEGFPEAVQDVLEAGLERLHDHQDAAYGDLYLERLKRVLAAEGSTPDHGVLRETARYLALWMAYDDVIRVADLKSRASRHARIRNDANAKSGEPVHVTEFFKPGIDEISTLLPQPLARLLVTWAAHRGTRPAFHIPLHIRSDTLTGHLVMRFIAGRKTKRRKTLRFHHEQMMIERWLDAVTRCCGRSSELALEAALCGRLIKGYGDTRARAGHSFDRIFAEIIEPAAIGTGSAHDIALRVRMARDAALADEDGKALAAFLYPETSDTKNKETAPSAQAAE